MSPVNRILRSTTRLLIVLGLSGMTGCATFVEGLAREAQPTASGLGPLPATPQVPHRREIVYTSPTHPNYRTQFINIPNSADERRNLERALLTIDIIDGAIQVVDALLSFGSTSRLPLISEALCRKSFSAFVAGRQTLAAQPQALADMVIESKCRGPARIFVLP
jgi:hypothetical protein